MKKYIMIIVILFTTSLVLGACSNNENNNQEDEKGDNEENMQDENQNNNGENHDDRVGSDKWADDDIGLSMGDTGLSDSNLGKAEITLDSAEKVDEDELEEDVDYTPLIAVHLTVKNIGNESFDPEEVLSSGLLIGPGEEYGSKWMYYEVSEEWKDTLDPNDETSGIIVFSHTIEDEYELIFGDKRSGSSNAESSNKTSFKFSNDEVN